MTRYDSFDTVACGIDHETVVKALQMVHEYTADIDEKLSSTFKITVDNGNVYFFSPMTEKQRYFVEVKPATNTIKIILASNPYK